MDDFGAAAKCRSEGGGQLLGEQSNDVVCDRKERMNSWVASLLRQDWQCEPANVIWIGQAIPPIDSH